MNTPNANNRYQVIKSAYHSVGTLASHYDGMMTYSSLLGKFICRLVWSLDGAKTARYVGLALRAVADNFQGSLLEVPIGTGCLSLPVYMAAPKARITCLDYSPAMLSAARARGNALGLTNIDYVEGDVTKLSFSDNSFEAIVSINGFHAFPNKELAYSEVQRVLKKGGVLSGSVFVLNENKKTDFFITKLYAKMGFFTPPFDTKESLLHRLQKLYSEVDIECVESLACFHCVK